MLAVGGRLRQQQRVVRASRAASPSTCDPYVLAESKNEGLRDADARMDTSRWEAAARSVAVGEGRT